MLSITLLLPRTRTRRTTCIGVLENLVRSNRSIFCVDRTRLTRSRCLDFCRWSPSEHHLVARFSRKMNWKGVVVRKNVKVATQATSYGSWKGECKRQFNFSRTSRLKDVYQKRKKCIFLEKTSTLASRKIVM